MLLASAIASSASVNLTIGATGPKISSLRMPAVGGTSSSTVGA